MEEELTIPPWAQQERPYYIEGLARVSRNIAQWAERKGFLTPRSLDHQEEVLAKIMLICCELAEAAEAVRDQDEANFVEELADAVIRLLHLVGGLGEDPAHWLEEGIKKDRLYNVKPLTLAQTEDVLASLLFSTYTFSTAGIDDLRDRESFFNVMAYGLLTIIALAEAMNIDLAQAVEDKMYVNEGRPVRHGRVSGV